MNEFLKFFDEKARDFPMHMEIYYSKIMDWSIKVWKKGCKADYPGAAFSGDDVIILHVQDSDLELCFAEAQVRLKNWLRMHTGGAIEPWTKKPGKAWPVSCGSCKP